MTPRPINLIHEIAEREKNIKGREILYTSMCDMYAQVNESFVSNINRIYYWNIDNSEDFLYNGAIPQVRVQKIQHQVCLAGQDFRDISLKNSELHNPFQSHHFTNSAKSQTTAADLIKQLNET